MLSPRSLLSAATLWLTALLTACTQVPPGAKPIQQLDLTRYQGTWYEIARLDHSFERGLTHVTADYLPRDDGGIRVINRGFDPAKQRWQVAEGKAYSLAPDMPGSLKVSFFGPFYGGYHILKLSDDYRYALISGPSHEYLWILARTPTLPAAELDALLQQAKAAGFATDALIFTDQRTPRPQSEPTSTPAS